MQYPANYGYVNKTLSDDGDPVDVLVMSPHPLIAGSVIKCRPVGVLNMTDESGQDAKVIAVPVDKLSSIYSDVKNIEDVPALLKSQIEHFFSHYKDLEKGKWVKIEGWADVDAAKAEITSSVERYNKTA
jgi:inorganic pyrophosphatase